MIIFGYYNFFKNLNLKILIWSDKLLNNKNKSLLRIFSNFEFVVFYLDQA